MQYRIKKVLSLLLKQFTETITWRHRHTGHYFLWGLSHLYPKNFLTAPEKNCYANLQNYFARLTHPVIISKNPRFGHFISLDRMNSVFSLNKYNFFIFGSWLLPKKFSFCLKNNGFALLARMPMHGGQEAWCK